MTITAISQDIIEAVRYRNKEEVINALTVTVGEGKDFETILSALESFGDYSGYSYYIVRIYPGIYENDVVDITIPSSAELYIVGMGATPDEVVIRTNMYYSEGGWHGNPECVWASSGSKAVIENVKLDNVGSLNYHRVWLSGDVKLYINKCIINGGLGMDSFGSGGCFAVNTSFNGELHISYSTLLITEGTYNGNDLCAFDKSYVYLDHVAYSSLWVEFNCTGTLAQDDKAESGTVGYGYQYGEDIVLPTTPLSISQPVLLNYRSLKDNNFYISQPISRLKRYRDEWVPYGRGIIAGGGIPVGISRMEYFSIDVPGTAVFFGDLTCVRSYLCGCSSKTRGISSMGGITGSSTFVNIIDYVTITTIGNAEDFGNLTKNIAYGAGCSTDIRGIFGGGYVSGNSSDIDFFTIATLGDASHFGNLTFARFELVGVSSPTRGLFAGGLWSNGSWNSEVNIIDYIEISTESNAADFGDLGYDSYGTAACSSNTRAIFGGGQLGPGGINNYLEYVEIATLSNTTFFGQLYSTGDYGISGTSNGTIGTFVQGISMDTITIATLGNASAFGGLSGMSAFYSSCLSDSHGGLS